MPDRSSARNKSKPQSQVLPAEPIFTSPAFGRELSNWLFPVYLGLILLGFILIRHTPGTPNGPRAIFCAINAGTLTGFQSDFPIDGLSGAGKGAVLGLVIVGSLFSMIVGALAMVRILRLRYTDQQVIVAAFMAELTALAVGMAIFVDAQHTLFATAMRAACAWGNCGLIGGKIPDDLPNVNHLLTHAGILPLSILGGLGLPVLMDLFDSISWRKPISIHSKSVLSMTAWVFIIGFVLLLLLDLGTGKSFAWEALRLSIPKSSATVLESRTLGMPLVPAREIPLVGQWIVIALMAIGASSAGTGGGLKTNTVAVLIRGTRDALAGRPVSRSFGFALAWLAGYAAIVLGSAMLLSYILPGTGLDGTLFTAVSAASNVGLSTAAIPDRPNVYYGLSAIMLLGRMAPLMVLWWMAESNVTTDVAIG